MEDLQLSPDINYDDKKLLDHKFDSLLLLLYTFLLTLTVLTVWLFKHRRLDYVHETGLAIVYGLVVGAVIRFGVTEDVHRTSMKVVPTESGGGGDPSLRSLPDQVVLSADQRFDVPLQNRSFVYDFQGEEMKKAGNHNVADTEFDAKAVFDPEIFFNILLPPIIFHAGYSMKRKYFFRNLGSILTFAFVGTTISTFSVGGFMYGVCQAVPHLSNITFLDNLHFGALISATDPVTVLAIFSDLNVDVTLNALVFGESVLNDAVAIVFSETLKDYEESVARCSVKSAGADCSYSALELLRAVLDFFGIFGASFVVGSVMGCVTALLTKFTQIRQHPLLESTLFVLMSYSTFLLAEVLDLTGIVSVLFCGITQAHYTYNNLSHESQVTTRSFFDVLNFMAENFIFSYIGVAMFTFPRHRFDVTFTIGAFVAILVGRFLNVYPLSGLLNIGRKHPISGRVQHMMMWSGLRGAIAFSLAIRNTFSESRQMILSTTLIIVIVTVIVNGGLTLSMLGWLGIKVGVTDEGEDGAGGVVNNNSTAAATANMKLRSGTSSISSSSSEIKHIANSSLHNYHTVDGGLDRRESADMDPAGGGDLPVGGEVSGLEDNGSVGDSFQQTRPDKSLLARKWGQLDNKLFKPLFTHAQPTLLDTLPTRCLPIGRWLTSSDQLREHPLMKRRDNVDGDNSVDTAISDIQQKNLETGPFSLESDSGEP